jgi:glucose/arabinose dehydrogenase
LYFTENIPKGNGDNCGTGNCTGPRVVNSLFVYDLKDNQLVNPKLLLRIPTGAGSIGLEHIGGKLTLGPDTRIYITGGDGYPCRDVQDCKESVSKGILNSNILNAKGSIATGTGGILVVPKEGKSDKSNGTLGNYFPLNLYYAYGIRNSFGLDFDPVTGNLWDTENGPYFGDEINLVGAGFNSGWAKAQGIWSITDYRQLVKDLPFGYHYPKANTPADRDSLFSYHGKGKYSAPEFTWYKSTGLTALKFFDSNRLGEQYKDDILVGSYNKGRIYHFELNEDRNTISTGRLKNNVASSEMQLATFIFGKGFGPVTDLQVSPDGYLYVLTYEGTLWKIIKSNPDN